MQTNTLANILLYGLAIPGWFYIQIARLTINDPDTLLAATGVILGAQLTALTVAVILKGSN